jgi:hydroxymethylglutaryl-CoA reductase
MLHTLLAALGLSEQAMTIEVIPHVPRAMGLGGSSALAVAIIRALDHAFRLGLDDATINAHAYECEKFAHGTPSGIDNTIATYGKPLLFQRAGSADARTGGTAKEPVIEPLRLGAPIPLVIGITGRESLTANTVARVRQIHDAHPARYDAVFDQIANLTRSGVGALQEGNLAELGELMNLCQGYLNALQVSTPELEELIHIARAQGALGAKLTGGGGGGSMIALCPDRQEAVAAAMEQAGYKALVVSVG